MCLVKQICGGNIGGWVGQVFEAKTFKVWNKRGEGWPELGVGRERNVAVVCYCCSSRGRGGVAGGEEK